MNAIRFAWLSLSRQPARAALGILGVAAVGALLFDMLLLSQGLVVSMRDLLDRTGWDVRVTASDDLPRTGGRRIADAGATAAALAALPDLRGAIAVRFADAQIERRAGAPLAAAFEAVSPGPVRPWTVLTGADAAGRGDVVVNQAMAATLGLAPPARLRLRAVCSDDTEAQPAVDVRVSGIAEFPFETTTYTIGGTIEALTAACGGRFAGEADLILVSSSGSPAAAAAAVRLARPGLRAMTNEQMIGRIQQTGFTYFQQISSVLTAVTLSFAVLLIAVLLTVSVNQRLGQIAALRAIGFSRARVIADVLCESALIVGLGGLVSLPAGGLLAVGLDRILKEMPGIPGELHFFVFQPGALVTHAALLAATALAAALYPTRIVSRLPIAATLRSEAL